MVGFLGPGLHTFPFTIAFPTPSWEQLGNPPPYGIAADFPPSLDISTFGLKAHVVYSLKLQVQRRGLLHFDLSRKKAIPFRIPAQEQLAIESLYTTKVATLPVDCFQHHKPASIDLPIPLACRVIRLEMDLPSPTILYPHRPLSLSLSISVPRGLSRIIGTISLVLLMLRLRTSTTVYTGSGARTDVTYDAICTVRGAIPILQAPEEESYRVDSGLWRNHAVPSVPPSFTCPGMARMHALEVIAGFSPWLQEQVQVWLYVSET